MFNLFGWLKPSFGQYSVSNQTSKIINFDWKEINSLLSNSQVNHALIMADKCLDSALKDVVSGESMADRLKNAKNRFSPDLYNKIWEAHKMRNVLVHESGSSEKDDLLKAHIWNLRKGLESLGVKING